MFSLLRAVSSPIIINANVYRIAAKSYSDEKLTEREKTALFKSLCLVNSNAECYGIAFFKELFAKNPSTVRYFTKYGKDASCILNNKSFTKDHAADNVMHGIAEFVKKMDDPCEAERMMKELGKKHQDFCLKCEDLMSAEPILLSSMEYNLGDMWDAEIEEGWKKALKVMFRGLTRGLKDEE